MYGENPFLIINHKLFFYLVNPWFEFLQNLYKNPSPNYFPLLYIPTTNSIFVATKFNAYSASSSEIKHSTFSSYSQQIIYWKGHKQLLIFIWHFIQISFRFSPVFKKYICCTNHFYIISFWIYYQKSIRYFFCNIIQFLPYIPLKQYKWWYKISFAFWSDRYF